MFDWTFDVESERLIAMSVSLSFDLPLLSDVTESVLTEVLVLVLEILLWISCLMLFHRVDALLSFLCCGKPVHSGE